MDGHWIVPFKGRNYSGATDQNFLWKTGKLYVMDNHRAALWCWERECDLSETHSIIHIDQHYDTLASQLTEWMNFLPNLKSNISEYLDASYDCGGISCPVIQWGNYLSIHIERNGANIAQSIFATHKDGDTPRLDDMEEIEITDLLGRLGAVANYGSGNWVFNLDLDYFFYGNGKRLVSDEFFVEFVQVFSEIYSAKHIKVITLCMTPTNFTSGWEETENMIRTLLASVGVDFKLPESH